MNRMSDHPDWGYLVQEYHDLYRFGSAGGSRLIAGHRKQVRQEVGRALAANPEVALEPAVSMPVCAHLSRALDNGELERTAPMVRALAKVQDKLVWRHGYHRMPKHLGRKYAFAEVMGPRGPVVWSGRVVLGLVLFAPKTTYPQHSHQGITESYVGLSGAVSENDNGVYVPGCLILNGPGHEHAITTQEREPALLAYAWAGEPEALHNQEMTFTRKT